ncbi:MAG: PEP-CTERM sorting domain-containing protein, partial [Candidatus Omnitrophica bacterium]|nr:PEP-CTERM sorting domain-containing protein [Candidatus Omnitrophota bacterium]
TGIEACGASDGFDLTGVGAEYPIPEPTTMFLLGSGLLGLTGLGRRIKKFRS